MYTGLIVIALLSVAVVTGLASRSLLKLRLSAAQALSALLVIALGFGLRPYYSEKVIVGWGGLALLVLCAAWLVGGDNARVFVFNILSIAATGALVFLFYCFSAQSMTYGAEIVAGVIAGLSAFLLAHGARSGVLTAALSVFAADCAAYAAGASETLSIGAGAQFDAIMLAAFVFLAFYSISGYAASKYRASCRLKNKAEAAEAWEEE